MARRSMARVRQDREEAAARAAARAAEAEGAQGAQNPGAQDPGAQDAQSGRGSVVDPEVIPSTSDESDESDEEAPANDEAGAKTKKLILVVRRCRFPFCWSKSISLL